MTAITKLSYQLCSVCVMKMTTNGLENGRPTFLRSFEIQAQRKYFTMYNKRQGI